MDGPVSGLVDGVALVIHATSRVQGKKPPVMGPDGPLGPLPALGDAHVAVSTLAGKPALAKNASRKDSLLETVFDNAHQSSSCDHEHSDHQQSTGKRSAGEDQRT